MKTEVHSKVRQQIWKYMQYLQAVFYPENTPELHDLHVRGELSLQGIQLFWT